MNPLRVQRFFHSVTNKNNKKHTTILLPTFYNVNFKYFFKSFSVSFPLISYTYSLTVKKRPMHAMWTENGERVGWRIGRE